MTAFAPFLSSKAGAVLALALLLAGTPAGAQLGPGPCEDPAAATVCGGDEVPRGAFELIVDGLPAPVLTEPGDHAGLLRAAADLREDLEAVGGQPVAHDAAAAGGRAIIVGTLGRNRIIDRLVAEGRLDVDGVDGVWEAYVQQVVDNPAPGIGQALVIAGADMRGGIFGVYDLSRRAGVSPWHWWADVPVDRHDDLHITTGARIEAPSVRYRGIFLNDENPALYGWVHETYGGFNHDFYTEVFELILRQRGNYLWPAMWGKAFYDDDPLNAVMADTYGVVIGTSHHEPLGRAHVEWDRYGDGAWDYSSNADTLERFWTEGMERIGENEALVTIGMRGDGDEAMTEGTAIDLLERIVAAQRGIIEEVTGEPAAETNQVWALYKEVQDYYDQGMTVPDDVTLLFADDNWGNVRRLPQPGAEPREGGYGVYYHFDYVGDPRNYKWLNTSQIERTWEQMNLSWEMGARELWIVNVGDLKPMEFPISFFLDHAWDPEAMTLETMSSYTRAWAEEQFGAEHAGAIAEMLTRYTQYNARRKPELIGPDTFSLTGFDEAERVLADWQALADSADALRAELPEAYIDAYDQLVWFPIQASANLNALHIWTGRNRAWAEEGRVAANEAAERVREAFARDEELERHYHQEIADGKWNHFMSQTHISYTYWQQPEEDVLPDLASVEPARGAALGVAAGHGERPALAFHRWGVETRPLSLFNRGDETAEYALSVSQPWIRLASERGEADAEIAVSIDWDRLEPGRHSGEIGVRGSGGATLVVPVTAIVPDGRPERGTYVEADGHVTIEAEHHAEAVESGVFVWRTIPELGRSLSGVTAYPVAADPVEPGGDSPRLVYDVWLDEGGEAELRVTLSPTLDFRGQGGMRFAVSVDGGEPLIVNTHEGEGHEDWMRHVADSVAVDSVPVRFDGPGAHTVSLWLVDPGLVFQRLSVITGDMPDTYLGPPESRQAR